MAPRSTGHGEVVKVTEAEVVLVAVDCVFAPAVFLASRRTDRYPDMAIFTAGSDATPQKLVESLAVMCRIVVDVVAGADPATRAVLFGGSAVVTGAPADFVPRAGLELSLHAHYVCAGLGVEFEPGAEFAGHQIVALNPQPLPPREFNFVAVAVRTAD